MLRTGLIVSGPESSNSSALFESLEETVNLQERVIMITVSSGQSPNLKTVLKHINQHATNQAPDEETLKSGFKVKSSNYGFEKSH